MGEMEKYFKAIENEIVIDEVAYNLLKASPKQFSFLPRPTKWYRQWGQNKLFVLLTPAVWLFWNFGGAIIYFVLDFIRLFLNSRHFNSRLSWAQNQKTFAVAFSTRAYDIINQQLLGYEPDVWVILPWVPVNQKKTTPVPQLNIFEILSFKNQWQCLLLAISAVYCALAKSNLRRWNLQLYTAYRWFLVRQALIKLNGGVFLMAEHYDRWAVLMDSVVADNKKEISAAKNSQLIIVQHGALGSLTDAKTEASKFSYEIKSKLSAVDEIYVYDKASEDYFKQAIIKLADGQVLKKVHFFKPTIQLSAINASETAAILFVGHPLCEELQIKVLNKLKLNTKCSFYYKPHPLAKASELVYAQEWNVIRDSEFFPDVRLLISYPSTLVNEYANAGKTAVVHAIDLSSGQADSIVHEVNQKLTEKF